MAYVNISFAVGKPHTDILNPEDVARTLRRLANDYETRFTGLTISSNCPVNAEGGTRIGSLCVDSSSHETTLNRLQDALATTEEGDNLVSVARDAHRAEQAWALLQKNMEEKKKASSPRYWLQAFGAAISPVLNIAVFQNDLTTALSVAQRIAEELGQNYWSFVLFEGNVSQAAFTTQRRVEIIMSGERRR